jgi:vitamin B12/bleomycin/antimicrobial peptide transport system ATP-binding/permease protein
MVWFALMYAGIASFVSWRVGGPLTPLNAEHYAREANLRFSLMRVNERAEAIALYGGEADEKNYLNSEFDRVLLIMRQLVTGLTRLTWVTAGYGWFAIVAPVIVASPGYFAGDQSFGGLMVAVGAFNQVQQALRWYVDNSSLVALAGDAFACHELPSGPCQYGQAWRRDRPARADPDGGRQASV